MSGPRVFKCWACQGSGETPSGQVCAFCNGSLLLPCEDDPQEGPVKVRQEPAEMHQSAATPVQVQVFDPVKLPRRDNGRLDFPRWSCDHQTCIEVLNGHKGSLSKVVNECRSLGLSTEDGADMLDQWSWTWICSTAVWLRALRGSPTAETQVHDR